MELAQTILTLFFSTTINHFPLLLWGILISSVLAASNIDRIWSAAIIEAHPVKQMMWGCVLGLILPLGRYSNAIVARRLWLKQIPLTMVISFFFASVTLNPVSLWLHRKAFAPTPGVVFWELVFTLIVAIAMATIFRYYQPPAQSLISDPFRGGLVPLAQVHGNAWHHRITSVVNYFLQELWELSGIFILGCGVVSLCQTWLSLPTFLASPGQPLSQILQAMVAGLLSGIFPLANGFVAADWSLLATKGSTIAFLMVSSWFDLATIALMAYLLKPKPLAYLILLPLNLTLLLSLALDYSNY